MSHTWVLEPSSFFGPWGLVSWWLSHWEGQQPSNWLNSQAWVPLKPHSGLRMFLESPRSLFNSENTGSEISESSSSHRVNQRYDREGQAWKRQVRWSSLCHGPLFVGCYKKVLPTLGWVFPHHLRQSGQFFNWGSNPEDADLWQVDFKNTHSTL